MMVECEGTVKKWGNSLGFVIPSDLVEKEHLKENQKLRIIFTKKTNNLKELWGLLKNSNKTAQEMKDSIRRELYND
ncbi:MAG: AbrB/MazE/SpoVT family DNA-binding domain-containing protein [Candidatus Diapherotrites archaeon]|nr:AbrB/MazE/SpoVT family DNA-binding domain-containing protein [Candidatus Diapherotrites archaeon]